MSRSGIASSDLQDTINSRVYHTEGVQQRYRSLSLDRAEVKALLKYQPAFAGRAVLDIGVGTGRTSAYLAPLAGGYQGIDYSPVMLTQARTAFPRVSLHRADMRDLSMFANHSFDFVFATNNVFDAVSHDDRLRTLDECYRVARPGALLMFSSHNRKFRHALRGPRLSLSRNPATQAAALMSLARGVMNHRKVGALRRQEDDYALLNDIGHDFGLLHYYIDRDHQAEQLRGAGFETLEVFDHDGVSLSDGDAAVDSPWLMYVARVAPVTTTHD